MTNRPNATQTPKDLLAETLREYYGIRPVSVVHIRTVCGILAEDGLRYIWKLVRKNSPVVARLVAQSAIALQLGRAPVHVPSPVLNRYGDFLSPVGDDVGYLQPWLEGVHVQPADQGDRLKSVAAIAMFHNLAQTFPIVPSADLFRGSLLTKLTLKRNLLLQVWDEMVAKCPSVAGGRHLIFEAAEEAIQAISSPPPIFYVHRDMAPHNLLLTHSNSMYLIDFDESGFDDPLVDLMQFTNHGIHMGGLRLNYFREIVEVYQRNHPASMARNGTFWSVFKFPDVFARSVMEWLKKGFADDLTAGVERALTTEHFRQKVLAEDLR